MSYAKLPLETLQIIFCYLSKEELLEKIAFVCKKWSAVVSRVHPKTVVFNPPCNDTLGTLLEDFKTYSTFAPTVRSIKLNDTNCKKSDPNFCFTSIKMDKLASIIKCCCNLRQVAISMSSFILFSESLEQLQISQPEIQSLELNLTCMSGDGIRHFIDLRRLVNNCGSKLYQLSVTGENDLNSLDLFNFECSDSTFKEDEDQPKNTSLQIMHIAHIHLTMSRSCLEYIISGNFSRLRVLNLYITVKDSIGGAKDDIWDRLKNYCETSLKGYNIYCRNEIGGLLFSMDNVINAEDRFAPSADVAHSYDSPEDLLESVRRQVALLEED